MDAALLKDPYLEDFVAKYDRWIEAGKVPHAARILTAEFDVLADQGRAYAQRLEAAGLPVTFREYPGMLHDFLTLPGTFTDAWTAIRQVTDALRATMGGKRIGDMR